MKKKFITVIEDPEWTFRIGMSNEDRRVYYLVFVDNNDEEKYIDICIEQEDADAMIKAFNKLKK